VTPDAGQARLWQDGEVLVASRERLEARALATGARAWTARCPTRSIPARQRPWPGAAGSSLAAADMRRHQAFTTAPRGQGIWRGATRASIPPSRGLGEPVMDPSRVRSVEPWIDTTRPCTTETA
jgi:hypothetical protein